ncbi:MAG: hypothetical protein QHI48_11410 [Bacteroidota bacterium]|nr:hypothetical protein [Bacteroidota bacterium]
MNTRAFLIAFAVTFAIAFLVTVIVTYLFALARNGRGVVDWGHALLFGILFGLIFPLSRVMGFRRRRR